MNPIDHDYQTDNLCQTSPVSKYQVRLPSSLRTLVGVLLLLTVLITSACFEGKVVTTKVSPADAGKGKEMNGIFYALPRTIVKVDVPVVRTSKQPATFSVFTPCFFPNENYVAKKETGFAIDSEKVRFETLFIPDTNEVYMIKTRGNMFETRNLEVSLTESGVLLKTSAEVTNDTIDIVTGTIKTAAGLVAKGLPVFLSDTGELTNDEENCRTLLVENWIEDSKLTSSSVVGTDAVGQNIQVNDLFVVDAGVRKTASDKLALVANLPKVIRDKADFKGGYGAAKQIADRIEELEARRLAIVSEDPYPSPGLRADTLRIALDEMTKKITELKENNFLGSESKLTWNASFRFNPDPANLERSLFTLSKEYGVCSINVNQGIRPDPRFKIGKTCPGGAATCKPSQMVAVACNGDIVKVTTAPGENGEGGAGGDLLANRVRTAQLRQGGERGFYYRIPGRAIALLFHGASEIGRAPVSIAQFGEVVSLPASTGGRKTKYALELYEASGGLKNFSMGSSALIQQKNIDDVAGATSTLIEAKGERNKAKAPADELQQLEKQRKILEERKKIRELEKELGEGGTPDDEPTP